MVILRARKFPCRRVLKRVALTFHVDRDRDIALGVADAHLEDQDLLLAARTLPDQPGFRRGLRAIIDLSPVERLDVSAAGVRRAADLARAAPGGCGLRSCTIVAPADAVYGLARMYQTLLLDRVPVMVTRTMSDALTSLDPPERGDWSSAAG